MYIETTCNNNHIFEYLTILNEYAFNLTDRIDEITKIMEQVRYFYVEDKTKHRDKIKLLLKQCSEKIKTIFNMKKVSIKIIRDKLPNAFTILYPSENYENVKVLNNKPNIEIKVNIVLTSKLIEILRPEEVTAVILHEIGHHFYYKEKFYSYYMYISAALTRLLAIGTVLVGTATIITITSVILFNILLLGSAIYSRKGEYLADKFVTEVSPKYGEYLTIALEKITSYVPKSNRRSRNDKKFASKMLRYVIEILKLLKNIATYPLRSHPSPEKRICNVLETIFSEYPEYKLALKDELKRYLETCNIKID